MPLPPPGLHLVHGDKAPSTIITSLPGSSSAGGGGAGGGYHHSSTTPTSAASAFLQHNHNVAGPSRYPDHGGGPSSATVPGDGNSSGAQATRPPRKLNRSANQLQRNQACLPCRRRRIKCDAARPHCSSCVRSYRFLARTQPNPERDSKGVQCVYEDTGDGDVDDAEYSLSNTGDDPRAAVHKLEARIAELRSALARLTSPLGPHQQHGGYHESTPGMGWVMETANHGTGPEHAQQPTNVTPTSATMPTGHMFGGYHHVDGPGNSQAPLSAGPSMGPPHGGLDSNPVGQSGLSLANLRQQGLDPIALGTLTGDMTVSEPMSQQMFGGMPPEAIQPDVVDDEAGKVGGPFLGIFWPGWPPRLPAPSLLDHLVQTFFNVVPSISRILHRRTFLQRLKLPPTHANFPHTALLHAICAVTARYTAAVHTISVDEAVRRTNEEARGNAPRPQGLSADDEAASEECFGDRHAKFTVLEMQIGQVTGRRMLEIAQAQALLAIYYQQHAKWIEGWMMAGSMSRLAVPLGLLSDTNGSAGSRNALLDGPVEEWDRGERRMLMAYIMIIDCVCSTTSGWASSIPSDELISTLPSAREDFERGTNVPDNPQTWASTDLYTHHPVADNFILYCKGIHLLCQINKFKRKTRSLEDPASARNTPLFQKLDSDITAFHFSFPESMRDPLRPHGKKTVDVDLVGAHLLPHIAAIKLHETFADLTNPQDQSALRLLAEARACLSLVYLLTSTALDFSTLLTANTSFSVFFFVAARTFVLFYHRALETQDYTSAKVFLSEIDVFRTAFRALAQWFALGARHSGMIDQMLQTCHEEMGVSPEDIRNESDDGESWRRIQQIHDHSGPNSRPSTTSSVLESAVQQHHPLHVLFLSPSRGSFREKLDVERGFQQHARGSSMSVSSGERGASIHGDGKEWLQHMSPAVGRTATGILSPEEGGDPRLPPMPPAPPAPGQPVVPVPPAPPQVQQAHRPHLQHPPHQAHHQQQHPQHPQQHPHQFPQLVRHAHSQPYPAGHPRSQYSEHQLSQHRHRGSI